MKPMLAKTYAGQKISGWLVSEKLDGVRAIWTGSELLSRNGKIFHAPAWFTDQLPVGVVLDGELFLSRQKFQTCVGYVRKKNPVDAEWRQLKYLVFDAPEHSGGFESRLEYCREVLTKSGSAVVVDHQPCKDKEHLQQIFTDLVAVGAEGVMLRAPGSKYENKRSKCLLKLKPHNSDEAVVIDHLPGEGRHRGRLGALVCKWRETVFNIGSGFTDTLRECPPEIGSNVTFMFQGLTDGGVPRFPVFVSDRGYE